MFLRTLFGFLFMLLLGCASAGPSTGLPIEYSKKVSASSDQEACFSPDEHCEERILAFIGGAKRSVDIAAYELTLVSLANTLASLKELISVRIVVNEINVKAKKPGSALSILREAGAKVRVGHQGGLMHDKFTIVDGTMVETGSFNYSEAAGKRNQENQVYLSASSLVARFNERFEKMWDEALTP